VERDVDDFNVPDEMSEERAEMRGSFCVGWEDEDEEFEVWKRDAEEG
jgi:hypothetical protein